MRLRHKANRRRSRDAARVGTEDRGCDTSGPMSGSEAHSWVFTPWADVARATSKRRRSAVIEDDWLTKRYR